MGESGSAKPRWLAVDLAAQVLTLFQGPTALHRWPVSTGRQGIGEGEGSGRTPRGWHRIRACIGAGQPPGAVFVGRRPTGEVYTRHWAGPTPSATGSSAVSSGCVARNRASTGVAGWIPSAATFTFMAVRTNALWGSL